MHSDDKGLQTALGMPFEFLIGICETIINTFKDAFLLPVRMIVEIFNFDQP